MFTFLSHSKYNSGSFLPWNVGIVILMLPKWLSILGLPLHLLPWLLASKYSSSSSSEVDCLRLLDRNGDHKQSNLKFKAWNFPLAALTNNLRSTPSPIMIKIVARIVLEVIINGQINILTLTLSHVFTLNNFFFQSCFTLFGFFPLIVSPLLPFTTQLLLLSKNLWVWLYTTRHNKGSMIT